MKPKQAPEHCDNSCVQCAALQQYVTSSLLYKVESSRVSTVVTRLESSLNMMFMVEAILCGYTSIDCNNNSNAV